MQYATYYWNYKSFNLLHFTFNILLIVHFPTIPISTVKTPLKPKRGGEILASSPRFV